MRGRSCVPLTLLRTRQCRRCARSCSFSVLMESGLLHRFAFLANDLFAHVTDALAFVRFGRVVTADFSGDLADHLFARTFDGDLGVFFNGHLDLVGNRIIDRVRVPQAQVHVLALNGGLEPDALDLEFLNEPFADALDHVVENGPAETVQGPGLGVVTVAVHLDPGAFNDGGSAGGQLEIELALGAFDEDRPALDVHRDLGGDLDRQSSYA